MPSELPPPLPPEQRTVGQLVGESIRLYGRRFWHALALGIGPAAIAVAGRSFEDGRASYSFFVVAGPVVVTVSYVAACAIVRPPARPRALLTAVAVGVLVVLPVPFLLRLYLLPAAAYLAFFGLAVPVAVYEHTGIKDSIVRATRLARADYVHALGSLAALAIVGILSQLVLAFLLRDQADNTLRVAGFFSILVVSPLLFLGAALLYFDQDARLRSRSGT